MEISNTKSESSINKSKCNKCNKCKKKLSLAGAITCKCGNLFCMEHRYPFVHDCTYDHTKEQQERLAKENPVVVSDKFVRI
jgi:predicted nucleic acid binding AN1-type Zn finger protein